MRALTGILAISAGVQAQRVRNVETTPVGNDYSLELKQMSSLPISICDSNNFKPHEQAACKEEINQKNRMLKECTEECESNASGNFPFEAQAKLLKLAEFDVSAMKSSFGKWDTQKCIASCSERNGVFKVTKLQETASLT